VLGHRRKRPQALYPDGISAHGESPLSAPIQFRDRLAHQRLDKLDPDLLWVTSVLETPVLFRIMEQLHNQTTDEWRLQEFAYRISMAAIMPLNPALTAIWLIPLGPMVWDTR
jgi:hypothetical protein